MASLVAASAAKLTSSVKLVLLGEAAVGKVNLLSSTSSMARS